MESWALCGSEPNGCDNHNAKIPWHCSYTRGQSKLLQALGSGCRGGHEWEGARHTHIRPPTMQARAYQLQAWLPHPRPCLRLPQTWSPHPLPQRWEQGMRGVSPCCPSRWHWMAAMPLAGSDLASSARCEGTGRPSAAAGRQRTPCCTPARPRCSEHEKTKLQRGGTSGGTSVHIECAGAPL